VGIYQALHELEVSELRLELQKIQDCTDGLDALVASTIKRATKAENSLQRSSTRGKTTRAERNEHWRTKICKLRDSWKQSAVEDVEAAHGAVVVRLKELKAQALTTKRAAVDAAARAEKLSDTRLAKMREADELASELQERVDSLEATTWPRSTLGRRTTAGRSKQRRGQRRRSASQRASGTHTSSGRARSLS
jgi:hypothetical protein